jgi:hypothetical protein
MNFKEIIEELKKQDIPAYDFAFGDIENPLPNIGNWEEVDQEGGEGQGDHWHSVKYFKDHNIYINIYGFYTSHDGTDIDDGYSSASEVAPKLKTITVYENLGK